MQNDTVDIISNWLYAFDAKERNHVLSRFVDKNTLNTGIISTLKLSSPPISCINLDESEIKFQCMDYHLDWIWATLHATKLQLSHYEQEDRKCAWMLSKSEVDVLSNPDKSIRKKLTKYLPINFTHQDADWFIYLPEKTDIGIKHNFVLIECKFANQWDHNQMAGKLVRLAQLKKKSETEMLDIHFTFVLMSPHRPGDVFIENVKNSIRDAQKELSLIANLDVEQILLPLREPYNYWIELKNDRQNHEHYPYRVARCNANRECEDGTSQPQIIPAKKGKYWGVLPRE